MGGTGLGVDRTAIPCTLAWIRRGITGGTWARPVLNGDNPLSTAFVSNCAYDFSNAAQLVNLNASYLTFDNFEIKGVCWSGADFG